ncbi:pyruvoyl-dependent arginine decarboxylase [Actinoplanes sp. NPDC051851]|uniref:pyruvoyl-dependent arginine decarboxylase n=1 Tax=Actinoplanes sp. NPDC051851 TaxID=3154753 RepID=UPI003433AAB0
MRTSAVYDQIPVLRKTGSGTTSLAAFHDALVQMDCGFYNLVRLSSVIPPGTTVDPSGKAGVPEGAWGDRLFCVYAEQHATLPGEEAWAGIGWVQRRDGQGGLFVEHEGTSEAFVTNAIRASLRDLVKGHEDAFEPADYVVHGAVCQDEPVCALVLAPYETVAWNGVARD